MSAKSGNAAPSDINPLADYVQGAVWCLKEKKTKHSHAASGCGNVDAAEWWYWPATTLRSVNFEIRKTFQLNSNYF